MFIRSFLLAILAASLLGLSSACLTPSQVESMFNKNTDKMKKMWAKAKVRLSVLRCLVDPRVQDS
jgi:hypothetical protein